MTEFGGLGGIVGGRALNTADDFEGLINRLFGERIRTSEDFASDVWCALTNVEWRSADDDTAVFSYRAAGDLVAAVRGAGDYNDWYCSGSAGCVIPEIEDAMSAEGWAWQEL